MASSDNINSLTGKAQLGNISGQSTHQSPLPVQNLKQEIEKLALEVENLLAKTPKDDPLYKSSAKKLAEVKHVLEKKNDGGSLWDKIRVKNNGRKIMTQGDDGKEQIIYECLRDHHETQSDTEIIHFDRSNSAVHHQPQDLINMNLDDSILYAVDKVISAYEFIVGLFK